jgi:uncharacterized protein (TIGR02246 family)
MARVVSSFFALVLTSLLLPAVVRAAEHEIEQEVARATAAWVDAYNSRDAMRIMTQYAPDALFWGTRASAIADQPEQIAAYFQESVRNPNLRVTISDQRIRVYGQTAVSAGVYTLTDVKEGQVVSTPGRFTFVFEKRGAAWVIVHHHSSRMPPSP